MNNFPAFTFRTEWFAYFEAMSADMRQRAILALRDYVISGKRPQSRMMNLALCGIMLDIDRQKNTESNRETPEYPGTPETPQKTTPCAKENEKEKEQENESEKENKRKKEKKQKKKRIKKEKDKEKEIVKEKDKEKAPPPLNSAASTAEAPKEECGGDAPHSGGGGGGDIEILSRVNAQVLSGDNAEVVSSDNEETMSGQYGQVVDAEDVVDAEKFRIYFNAIQARHHRAYTVQAISGPRYEKLCLIARQFGKQIICQVLEKAARSDFINDKNKFHRHLGFDWLVYRENFVKVLEGYYDNPPEEPKMSVWEKDLEEERRRKQQEAAEEAKKNYATYEDYRELKARAEAGDKEAQQLLLPPELREKEE